MRLFALYGVLLLVPSGLAQSLYENPAKYKTPEEGVKKATELDVGRAELIGPRTATAGGFGEFTIRFTVGRAGLATGGGLRIGTQHDLGWDMWGGTRLQHLNPRGVNYVSYRASSGARLKWSWLERGHYFPWQRVNEFLLVGESLAPGDTIEIVFGDRSGGSPGVAIQPMDESEFEQKFFVDAFGEGEFLPLANSPTIAIEAADGKELKVIAPTDWDAGKPGWVNVWVDDGLGNPAASFGGTVRLSSDHSEVSLPAAHKFTQSDEGAHRFEGVVIERPGVYRVRARTDDGWEALSNPFVVHASAPEQRVYWGDLHTHTKYSDGRGTPAEMYDFGKRYAAIDFCSVSDHAFITTDVMWEDIKRTTREMNEPGRYVTFLGYEWSGSTDVGGDHNVYTTGDEMPLLRSYLMYEYSNPRIYHGPTKQAGHVEDLFRALAENFRDENLLVIPHYGGRPGNPEWHNSKLQRQIEVFSDHRRSENWVATYWQKGHRVGVMASTDNHSGNAGYGVRREERDIGEDRQTFSRFSPAERGTALLAVYGEELTRTGVFQGIYHRRTYATTGERIILRFEVNGELMGGEIRASGAPRISVSAVGMTELKAVRIVKNGEIIHSIDPRGDTAALEFVDRTGADEGAYYYADVVQVDGEKAISSPVWVN